MWFVLFVEISGLPKLSILPLFSIKSLQSNENSVIKLSVNEIAWESNYAMIKRQCMNVSLLYIVYSFPSFRARIAQLVRASC